MRRTLPAVALVVISSIAALFVPIRNRSEIREQVQLSEREFFVERESRERSSVFLRLVTTGDEMAWLDERKMQALGFAQIRTEEDSHQLGRRGFVALELDGPTLRRYEDGRRGREDSYRFSRLVPVNFSLVEGELQRQFPDRSRYLVVRGTVQPMYFRGSRPARLGSVTVDMEKIFVSKEFRDMIPREPESSRFQVLLRFGKNYEPWLVGVRHGE